MIVYCLSLSPNAIPSIPRMIIFKCVASMCYCFSIKNPVQNARSINHRREIEMKMISNEVIGLWPKWAKIWNEKKRRKKQKPFLIKTYLCSIPRCTHIKNIIVACVIITKSKKKQEERKKEASIFLFFFSFFLHKTSYEREKAE